MSTTVVFASCLIASIALASGSTLITVKDTADLDIETLTCHQDYGNATYTPKCKSKSCARRVTDGLFTELEIENLHNVVQKGMSQRPALGGPTILDINTGYIRDSQGLENLFTKPKTIYRSLDFEQYGNIIRKLKKLVEDTFSISDLYFTAPTFITRLDGNASWVPEGAHDEYWHPHIDGLNTPHYHYSGLLYMSTYEKDFTGGLFHFLNEDQVTIEQIVEPKAGRVVIFSSGLENPHYVERVLSGNRYVLAFFFTCDKGRKFENFLDGKAHTTFSLNFSDRLKHQERQAKKARKEANRLKRQKAKEEKGLDEL